MDTPNAFIGKAERPTAKELSAALGPSAEAWNELVDWMAKEHGVTVQEWKCYSPKYGWTVKLMLKKRAIVHLGPCDSCFRVMFILGDKAVKAAKEMKLAKSLVKLIEEAPRYPEGTGIRLMVRKAADLAAVRTLAQIKLAN
ncbi:MAG TPA: DUF3788 family protein [Terriglobales bacterium]